MENIENTQQYSLGFNAGYESVNDDRERGVFKPYSHYTNELNSNDDYDNGFIDGVGEFFA